MNLKHYFPIVVGFLNITLLGQAQTNTFPPSGNVGIGTLTPAEQLHVNGRSVFNNDLKIDFGTPNRRLRIADWGLFFTRTVDGNEMSTITAPDNYLDYSTRSAHRFTVNGIPSMNVQDDKVYVNIPASIGGVVTNDPSFRLFVGNGNTSSPGNGIFLENRRVAAGGRNYLYFSLSDNGNYNIPVSSAVGWIAFNTLTNIIAYTNGQTAVSGGATYSLVDLTFHTYKSDGSYAERMRFTSDGYLGIGTTGPSAKLHTNGTVRFQGLSGDNTQNRVLVTDVDGNLSYRDASTLGGSGTAGWTFQGNSISAGQFIGTTNNEDLIVKTNNVPQMMVSKNGQVAIGLPTFTGGTSTGYKLYVAEGVRTRKVKVDINTWPDFVFHRSYQLPTLEFVEQYIKRHQRLPDVPSAATVAEEGLDLGDSQAVLLQKIEELTLYVIELNKKLNERDKKYEEMAKELEDLKKLVRKN